MASSREAGRDSSSRQGEKRVTSLPANINDLRRNPYTSRIIVAGTRYWDDYAWFRASMATYLRDHHKGQHIAFIGGEAPTGADALLKRWVEQTPFDYYGFVPQWDSHLGKRAGFERNKEMGGEASHLLTFWDGKSRGTKQMQEFAADRGLIVHSIDISKPRR